MGKLLKIVGGLLGLILLLVVAAVVIIPMVIDPNDYKDEIIAKVQEQTGRTLKMDGDLQLSVFPWLGVELGALELGNARGFGDKPFAAVKHVAVRVKLIPLLSSKLEVDTIRLDGLQLNLAKNKAGTSNWDDLVEGGEAKHDDTPDEAGSGLAGFPIGGVDINNAQVTWDDRSSGQKFSVDQFSLKSGSITSGQPVALEMEMVLESSEPQLKAKIEMKGTVSMDEAAGLLKIAGLTLMVDADGKAFATGALHAELETAASLTLDGTALTLDGLKVRSGELQLAGDLKGADLNSKPAFSGKLSLTEFNLREWLVSQGISLPEMADPKVLGRFAAQVVLSNQGDATKLSGLMISLDDTKISGDATLKGAAVAFNLDVDAIDLDRYLPPAKDEPVEKQAPSSTTGDEELMPIEMLRGLDLNSSLKVGKLTINKLHAEQLQVTIKARKGKLETTQKIGKFYQGNYTGKVNLNVAGKSPVMNIEQHLANLQAGPLVKDLTGQDKFDGKGSFNAKLNTRGNSINAIKRSLGGTLDFNFADGAVKGFNLAKAIRETKAKFSGSAAPASDAPNQTDFSKLSGSAVISKGVLTNKDLLAKSPYLRITGAGKVNLVPETLDYTVKAVIVSTAKGQGGEGLDDLKGIPVPIHLTGPYASPDYSVDWGQVLAGSQKAKLEEKKEEMKQKFKSKLQDKLKGLFN